jgi:hypothetical protein
VDERSLAAAVVEAVATQRIDGELSPLDPQTFAWLVRWAPDAVEDPPSNLHRAGARFLRDALWTLADERGRRFMLELARTDPDRVWTLFGEMLHGGMRSAWTAAEMSDRLHALCEIGIDRSRLHHLGGLPRETAAAQVRLVCTGSRARIHRWQLTMVAANLRSYLSGDAASDVQLIWWDVPEAGWPCLRDLLDAAGPIGTRKALVDAAAGAGRIGPQARRFLGADAPRPVWADGDPGWRTTGTIDAGTVFVPDGRLSAGDPFWTFEGVPFVLDVTPGRHPVRVLMAEHWLAGPECAAAELRVAAGPAARWEPVVDERGDCGYTVEVGVGSFGATAALVDPGETIDAAVELGTGGQIGTVDAGDRGTIVAFTVGPQHQQCRTWAGYGTDGTVVAVVTDLGLVGVDPTLHPDDPLRPGPAPHPDRPAYQFPVGPGGVRVGDRLEAIRGSDRGRRATVREGVLAEWSWLHVDSVRVCWEDTRAGELLPAADVRERFVVAG